MEENKDSVMEEKMRVISGRMPMCRLLYLKTDLPYL